MTAVIATSPAFPAALSSEHVRLLISYPDALIVAWLDTAPARDALSDRELTHAAGLATTERAAYVRGQLATGGDLAVARHLADFSTGARISLDGRYYVVTRPLAQGRRVEFAGQRGGRLSLSVPAAPGQLWYGHTGRITDRTWRPVAARRFDASHFVSVPAR